ncbi:MAG: trigger factor [Actinomycetota bacterium]
MQTTVAPESPTKRKLTVAVSPEEVEPVYQAALKRLAREVKIPGFRPGKAPKAVIESRIGKDTIKDEVLRDALPTFYAQAATEESLSPLTQPEIEVTSFEVGEPLNFIATVEVRPEFKLPDYQGLKIKRPEWKATDEDVAAQLDRLREQFGTLESVTRYATRGDFVTMDVFGTRHGEKIEELSTSDLVYEIGSASFVAELDDELEGKKAGDIVKFNSKMAEDPTPAQGAETTTPSGLVVPGPQSTSADLSAEATFQVVVKEVQAKKLPDADDEFAKMASEFDTLDELKAELRTRIESVKKYQADLEVQNQIVEELVDGVEIPIPDSLLQRETEARLSRLIRELERAGLTLDQYLKANDSSEEELVKGAREAANATVAADLLLEAIAKAEGLEVGNQDIAFEVAAHARQSGQAPEELLKELQESGRANVLAGDILRRKALDFLVEHSEITEHDGSPVAPALSEGSEKAPEDDTDAPAGAAENDLEGLEKAPEQE